MKYEENETYKSGSYPSFIEKFEIIGLHKYKNVSLTSLFAATILIAQNGAGKTTLLNAIDALVKCQFLRLNNLNFSEIRCKLRGEEEEIVITREDIRSLSDLPPENSIIAFSKKLQMEPVEFLNFLSLDLSLLKTNPGYFDEHPVYDETLRTFEFKRQSANEYLINLQQLYFSQTVNIGKASTLIRKCLKDVEVIYLPTYRRVESPLAQNKDGATSFRGRKMRLKILLSASSGDIQFGLSDISDRLVDLNQEILSQSNRGYRKLTTDIIKELLDGTFDRAEIGDLNLPNSDDLKLFFARLRERKYGPMNDMVIPDIDQLLQAQSLKNETNRFLLYFISKLNSVMQATKDIENQVEDFLTKCNRYLSNSDVEDTDDIYQQDAKQLRLNRADLSVYAVSLPSETRIDLEALSSGEKQMISLLAKLYLYPKQKIVLIDEPELSLSIDWQRNILQDIINAPTCVQLVAITHSPFVFDNALEPFARSLKISIERDLIPKTEESIDGDDI